MRFYQLTESDNKILYHGTSSKNLIGIMKYGLIPKPNRWEDKYITDPEKKGTGEVAVFCTPSLDDAKRFARQHDSSGGVVLSFTLAPSDTVDVEKFFNNEVLVRNKIEPSRLSIAYPEYKTLDSASEKAKDSLDKTSKIKEINKLTKELGIKIRSGSKSTDRVLTYRADSPNYDSSILLSEYPEWLKNNSDAAQSLIDNIKQIIG